MRGEKAATDSAGADPVRAFAESVLDRLNVISRLSVLEGAARTQHAINLMSRIIRHRYAGDGDRSPLETELQTVGAMWELHGVRHGVDTKMIVQTTPASPSIVERGRIVALMDELLAARRGDGASVADDEALTDVLTVHIGRHEVRLTAGIRGSATVRTSTRIEDVT